METMEKNFYTVDECATFLDCCNKTIHRLIEKKKLKANDIGTGKKRIYRIPVEELDRFLSETATDG